MNNLFVNTSSNTTGDAFYVGNKVCPSIVVDFPTTIPQQFAMIAGVSSFAAMWFALLNL